jgi:shikimate dehydrogenase
MRKFGLIGYPLGHSFSKKYFSDKFEKEDINDCEYNNYPLEDLEGLSEFIEREPGLCGLNVTIPYKEKVTALIHELDNDALEIGAVNTIKIIREPGKRTMLKGYNTDVYGFATPLKDVLKDSHRKALILGTGGAAKGVAWVLGKWGIEYRFVSRSPKRESDFSYASLNGSHICEYKLIVNTSPLGMYPNIDEMPDLDYNAVTEEHILYDLIYNPQETRFIKEGKRKKAITLNGLPMLYLQAEKAWEIWNT